MPPQVSRRLGSSTGSGRPRSALPRPGLRGRPGPDPAFFVLSARVERVLVQAVVALGVTVVLAQLLLTFPAARLVMSYVDRLEGVPLTSGGATVTVALMSGEPAHAAYLLVNGERAASFASGVVRVVVRPGDLLEVDGTGLTTQGVFAVTQVTGAVVAPTVGLRVTTDRSVARLGWVELELVGDG
ncbi:MAG: hypothetical protein K6U08_06835 [Firmicutes bacterium]|nr:hypothetical protein [Bacillota bacterium]